MNPVRATAGLGPRRRIVRHYAGCGAEFDRANACVRRKESELKENSSLPQAVFGDGVKDLELP